MTDAPGQTLIRRYDESKLEIGDAVPIKDGIIGVVVARFTPFGENRGELHYIVELRRARLERE
jgi:hypothetical protein